MGAARIWPVLALVGVVVGALVWMAWTRSAIDESSGTRVAAGENPARPAGPEFGGSGSNDAELNRTPVENPGQNDAVAGKVLIEDVLRDFWGAKWPEMERRLKEYCLLAGLEDCLKAAAGGPVPDWQEVAEEIHEKVLQQNEARRSAVAATMEMPELTDQGLRARFRIPESLKLDASAIDGIAAVGKKYEPEVQFYVNAWNDGLKDAVSTAWLVGRYERAPFIMPPPTESGVIYSANLIHRNWAVSIAIRQEDAPWLAEHLAALGKLRQARDEEVQRLIDGLR